MNIDINLDALRRALRTIQEKSNDAAVQLKGMEAIAQRFEDEIKFGNVGTALKQQILTQKEKLQKVNQALVEFVPNANRYIDAYVRASEELSSQIRNLG
jgi:predicted  nucleic acid-binding Zn-ribbon protein